MQRDRIAASVASNPGITAPRLGIEFHTSLPSITGQLQKLLALNRVARYRQPGQLIRWFASTEALSAWLLTPAGKALDQPRQCNQPQLAMGGRPKRAGLAQPDRTPAVSVQDWASGMAYDVRYQCAPGEQVMGGGFVAAGVGRDALTGRRWGA